MPDTPAGRAGDLGLPVLAPLYADGMPLAALARAVAPASGATGGARFWSTPPRGGTDATREVLEVSLGAARTLNTVAVSIPRFPHTTWLQAFDEDAAAWETLADSGGNPCRVTVADSLPPVVPGGVNSAAHHHPQHFGAGHWVPQLFEFTPVSCSRIRLVQARNPSASAPVGPTGRPVAYSLGARDLIAGFSTAAGGGTPLRAGPLASAADVLGSAVAHTVRRADAWGLPSGRIWRSAPQPTASAVVSLYLDCRDALGRPQVVDRLSLEPLTSGVSLCVYYSLDTPTAAAFPASDAPLGEDCVPSPVNPVPGPAGLVFTGAPCYLDIAANAAGFDPGAPFAVGIALNPGFASTATGPYTVIDAGGFTLRFAAGKFTAALGSLRATASPVFAAAAPLVLGIAYDGRQLSATAAGVTRTAVSGSPPAVSPDAAIRIGGALGGTPGPAAMTVSALAWWQCGPATAAAGLAAFLASPASVMTLPAFAAGPHPSDGTVLRLDAGHAGPDSPFGVFGGPGIDVNAVSWTPLARDAVARSGALPLPPVYAALVKCEFTNLAAAPVEVAAASPGGTVVASPGRQHTAAAASPGTADPGTALTAAVGSSFFSDMRRLPAAHPQPVSPTEALYAPDPRVAARIDTAPGFGFAPWQMTGQAVAPRPAGPHADAPVDVALARRAGFFVALRRVALGRDAAGTAPRDYARIVEVMGDAAGLGTVDTPTSWALDAGRLFTPAAGGGRRVTASAPFATHHPVVALQFAAQASAARQVLPDADFTGADLSAWTAVGDATLSMGTGYASAVGHAVSVRRGTGALGGIASLASYTPGRTGRLHAAARVYAPAALSAPLLLELVNADGTTLASARAAVGAGQVAEFTCTLELDVPLSPGVDHWSTYDGHGTYAWMAAHGTYGLLSGAGTWVRGVTVRLTQPGTSADLFFVDSLAMFSDPITWEASRDGGATWSPVTGIRNNPAAVLVFGPLTSGTGTSLMWRASCDAPGVSVSAVALRPWYELRAGGVRPPGVGGGPLLSPADHYGPIEDDPFWQGWSDPVPKGWWTAGRPSR